MMVRGWIENIKALIGLDILNTIQKKHGNFEKQFKEMAENKGSESNHKSLFGGLLTVVRSLSYAAKSPSKLLKEDEGNGEHGEATKKTL